MKIAYDNDEELEEEGDNIAYQNDERLDLNDGDTDSSDEEPSSKAVKNALKKGKGGLPRYASGSKKFDMSILDNQFRFLQHIDLVNGADES